MGISIFSCLGMEIHSRKKIKYCRSKSSVAIGIFVIKLKAIIFFFFSIHLQILLGLWHIDDYNYSMSRCGLRLCWKLFSPTAQPPAHTTGKRSRPFGLAHLEGNKRRTSAKKNPVPKAVWHQTPILVLPNSPSSLVCTPCSERGAMFSFPPLPPPS